MATIVESSRETAEAISLNSNGAKFWRSCAPEGAGEKDSWDIWSQHLTKRRDPKLLSQLCKAKHSPLGWGLNFEQLASPTVELLNLVEKINDSSKTKSSPLAKKSKSLLTDWLNGTRSLPQTIDYALECLTVAHALPSIAADVSEKFWWEMLDALWQVAQSAIDWRADAELPAEQGLAQQLLAGELPLTLAYLFPEIRPLYKLRTSAHEALSEGLLELLNGDGLVKGSYLSQLRALTACWTRCRAMGESFKKSCWNGKAEEQYQCLTSHAMALSSASGRSLLSSSTSAAWTPEFLQCLLRLGGDAADLTAARDIFGKKLTRSLSGKSSRRVPEHSDHCEWAGLAYMRTDWERNAPTLAIDFSSPKLRMEVWSGSQQLISGVWAWETSLNGKPLEPVGNWEETCWFSDEDVDYIELSIDLTNGARLERQILLARDEMFLLLADYIHGDSEGEIRHQYQLPLDTSIDFVAEEETREGALTTTKPIARVIPLALPEWRTDPRRGELSSRGGQLQLDQREQGRNLACPLFIDLNKSRASKQCTWRQLTVAQSLEIQPHDVAAGYRVQCGKQQWLIYRSLDEPANRTLLGQNTSLECLVANFLAPSGEIDELLEIEGR